MSRGKNWGGGTRVCTRCGTPHPKGKKQRSAAIKRGWSCKGRTNQAEVSQSGSGTPRASKTLSPTRKGKQALKKARHEAIKLANIEAANNREKLSPHAQLHELNMRLGIGVGAKRERARLAKIIAGGK